jgi:hypothetical protein
LFDLDKFISPSHLSPSIDVPLSQQFDALNMTLLSQQFDALNMTLLSQQARFS